TTSLPYELIQLPLRAMHVGKTRSNISIPRNAPPINEPGDPIPIKYLGLSLGIIGVVYSNTSFITSFDSPTDRPPIAYPGKSRDIISRALCFLKFSYSPP